MIDQELKNKFLKKLKVKKIFFLFFIKNCIERVFISYTEFFIVDRAIGILKNNCILCRMR